MKKHILFLLLIIEIALAGCSSHMPYPQSIQQAENCMTANPDSALIYLSSLKETIKDEPDETQIYHQLLTIKAEDKLYKPHTSDSLIKKIVSFYENYGDNNKLMEAYYYMGSIYRDMKDAPQALKAFQQAVDVGKEIKQYTLLGQTYEYMGVLFAYQGLSNESLEATQKALYYYQQQKDSLKYPFTTRNIARIYDAKGNKDSALYYYKKAYSLALNTKNKKCIDILLSELGCYYYCVGKTDTAKTMLLPLSKGKNDISSALLHLGLIYQRDYQLDSAQYYFNTTLKYGDIYKQRSAYTYLSHLKANQNKYQEALDDAYKSQSLMDSINVITQTEVVEKIHSLYNYQHTEHENHSLILKNKSYQYHVYVLTLSIILITFIGIYIVLHIKRNKKEAVEQERRLRILKEQQYTQSLSYIEENNQKLQEVERQLKETEIHNDHLNKQLLLSQKEMLELSNRRSVALQNNREISEAIFKQSEIYILFHKASNDEQLKITEAHWQNLQTAIDSTYYQFTNKLYSLYPPLSLQELRICYLIKISLTNKEIASLLGRTPSAITQARKRLYKKAYGETGSGEDIDNIIIEL